MIHGRGARIAVLVIFFLLLFVLIVSPILVLVLATFASSWNGVLPSDPTLRHVTDSLRSDTLASLSVSLQTAFFASLLALVLGAWAARIL